MIDSADLLTGNQEHHISSLFKSLEDSLRSQVAVLTLDSLNGQDITDYAIRQAGNLSLGRDFYDDWVLIVVAHGDRQARIQVGSGLVRIITDENCAAGYSRSDGPHF